MNLLMAYDVNTGMPLLSRMYEGGSTDGVSVKDLFRQVKPEKMLTRKAGRAAWSNARMNGSTGSGFSHSGMSTKQQRNRPTIFGISETVTAHIRRKHLTS